MGKRYIANFNYVLDTKDGGHWPLPAVEIVSRLNEVERLRARVKKLEAALREIEETVGEVYIGRDIGSWITWRLVGDITSDALAQRNEEGR